METESPFQSVEELKAFTVTMLAVYGNAARAQFDEAEALIARGIALREHAIGMLDRATRLAHEYAVAKDAADRVTQASEDGYIPW